MSKVYIIWENKTMLLIEIVIQIGILEHKSQLINQ